MDFNKYNILILTGDSGAGKSTIAEALEDHPRFGHLASMVSFGHYLRSIIDACLREEGEPVPWDLSSRNRGNRDTWERESGYKDKMIQIGDQVIARHPQAFINPVIQEILDMPATNRLIVVPDCRSPLELAALKSVGNVWGVRLVRDSAQVKKYDGMLKDLNLPLVDNNGEVDDTISKIAEVLRTMPNT